MSGRAGRKYRLRRRRRIEAYRRHIDLLVGMWSGMEMIITHPKEWLESYDKNVRLVARIYE